jgi:hypothetical protein
MAHLTATELVDLAEGARPESSAPHLRECDGCRDQLAALRATISIVADADADAPEPSPLFWDHFSARVRRAVEGDCASWSPAQRGGPGAGSKPAWWHERRPVWVAAVVVLIAAIGLVTRSSHPLPAAVPVPGVAAIPEPTGDLRAADDDLPLSVVADLAADLDWESAGEAGLTTHVGADDDAVNQLTDGERRELRQLLQAELLPPRRGA